MKKSVLILKSVLIVLLIKITKKRMWIRVNQEKNILIIKIYFYIIYWPFNNFTRISI